jgi:putative tryptophan/tyrosine transport system substrate-binding protein
VGDGFVVSMARPAGQATGFTDIPASMAGKWLELLKEMVPRISRVAVMMGQVPLLEMDYIICGRSEPRLIQNI